MIEFLYSYRNSIPTCYFAIQTNWLLSTFENPELCNSTMKEF